VGSAAAAVQLSAAGAMRLAARRLTVVWLPARRLTVVRLSAAGAVWP
jgi:hypothetical protein